MPELWGRGGRLDFTRGAAPTKSKGGTVEFVCNWGLPSYGTARDNPSNRQLVLVGERYFLASDD